MHHEMYQQLVDRELDPRDFGYLSRVDFREASPRFLSRCLNPAGPRDKSDDTITIGFPGAFAPFHEGHLEACRLAWAYYTKEYQNVRVVLFPSSSAYLRRKHGRVDSRWVNGQLVDSRAEEIRKMIAEYPYISVDWTMCHYEIDLNFPFIVDRLKSYSTNTVFLVGSDNRNFAPAFFKNSCEFLCIVRDKNVTVDPQLLEGVIYNELDTTFRSISSSQYRIQQ